MEFTIKSAKSIKSVTKKQVIVKEKSILDDSKINEPYLKKVKAKTIGQQDYLNAIEESIVTFGIGPAGTGKTHLGTYMACKALLAKEVERIILVRPAVEAGEKLGFLPGDLAQKVDPYLRPLFDALYLFLGIEQVEKLLANNVIEVAPLAFMRGRTLHNAVIILDEAQNCSSEQMKMLLTRIGFKSKAIITGDLLQSDLDKRHQGGLQEAIELVKNIEGISVNYFTKADVCRSDIVQRIVEVYEENKR